MKSTQNIEMNNQPSLIKKATVLAGILGALTTVGQIQGATITVNADQVLHTNSPYLTGACIEDVNHEIYGGIDSQMIFGESFAEPAGVEGFHVYGGEWIPQADGSLEATADDGPKLVAEKLQIADGEVSVDVKFSQAGEGNAGLIVKAGQAALGADRFVGYEISLQASGGVVLGRHRQNWEEIRRAPCDVPLNEWNTLAVKMNGKTLEVFVNGKSLIQYEDSGRPIMQRGVGLRNWRMDASFRNLKVTTADETKTIPLGGKSAGGVSVMWSTIQRGTATGHFSLENQNAFSGGQSQKISFMGGSGEIGIENQSLNRWGMNFVKGKNYEGYLWARAQSPTEIFVALESRDGSAVYGEKSLKLAAGDWQRLDFELTPNAADKAGRFAVKLKQPGSVSVGYVFLQPGSWGRFKDLPVRKDVAEGLINQGVTVLRYGGSMVNNPEYRWKKMIGPRAQRPPYEGQWYPYSSDGWGIFDFLNLCEAAGIAGIPDLDINESPNDMADFMDYLNGTPDSEWGKKRVADGHPAPYHLKYIELGNEEHVDDKYVEKFKAVAEVIWAKDPAIILIVGDFSYHKIITDPFNFTGADGGIMTLAGQRRILQLAKQHNREVWFDLHVWTDGPRPDSTLKSMFSYINAMDKIADGAKHKVLVFELNANNHSQRRALANALAINAIQRDGRLPLTSSANCLQPDGQNDNGWDQGLLFLNPSQVWLQPPGYVTQMISRNYQPLVVKTESSDRDIDVSAMKSEDGKTLVLQVVNMSEKEATLPLKVSGFVPAKPVAQVLTLEGPLDAYNTASAPEAIKPVETEWQHGLETGETAVTFPAHSFTVIRL